MIGEPIERREFSAQRLMNTSPPVWHHPNKQVVASIASPAGALHNGELVYSRWPAMALPDDVDLDAAAALLDDRPGYFDYQRVADDDGALEWHVNFADPHLFVAYGGSLFAQDEIQVSEHPALGALKEALSARGSRTVTVEVGSPTPVLVRGVERRCHVSTEPDVAEGRPGGLYGNAFAQAGGDVVARATRRIDPPTITNLIAMASLPPHGGSYDQDQIEYLLVTAFTGFSAAVQESGAATVLVHSGYWGCGAFGGNRILMVTIQAIAAQMAGLSRLVIHTGDPSGSGVPDDVRRWLRSAADGSTSTADVVQRLVDEDFRWGVSDGN